MPRDIHGFGETSAGLARRRHRRRRQPRSSNNLLRRTHGVRRIRIGRQPLGEQKFSHQRNVDCRHGLTCVVVRIGLVHHRASRVVELVHARGRRCQRTRCAAVGFGGSHLVDPGVSRRVLGRGHLVDPPGLRGHGCGFGRHGLAVHPFGSHTHHHHLGGRGTHLERDRRRAVSQHCDVDAKDAL